MSHPHLGLFGKLPTAGDFVAHQASSPAGRCYQDWIVGEVEHLASKRQQLGNTPIKFLVRDISGTAACIGVLVPSQDRVGRRFPLSAFVELPLAVASQAFPALPVAFAPFLDAAAVMLADASETRTDLSLVVERISALPQPAPSHLEEAQRWTFEALEHTAGQTLLEALFGPTTDQVALHGIHMFTTACGHVRGRDPGAASIILDCPGTDDVQQLFWLRLASSLLGWNQAPPSLLWTGPGGTHSRLLISLGAPAERTLLYINDPSLAAQRLWPMRTQSRGAIDSARAGLSPARLRALTQPPATAAELLDALIHG